MLSTNRGSTIRASPSTWGSIRCGSENSRDQLISWATAGRRLCMPRVRGWNLSGGALTNQRVMNICGSKNETHLTLRVDNRVVSIDPHGICAAAARFTLAPTSRRHRDHPTTFLKAGGGVVDVEPCGSVAVTAAQHGGDRVRRTPNTWWSSTSSGGVLGRACRQQGRKWGRTTTWRARRAR